MQNSTNSPRKEQGKDKSFKAQIEEFANYLTDKAVTATMVNRATSIEQKNITRYKRTLEKRGKLIVAFKQRCKVTKRRNVQYITTNPELIRNHPEQLKLDL